MESGGIKQKEPTIPATLSRNFEKIIFSKSRISITELKKLAQKIWHSNRNNRGESPLVANKAGNGGDP